MVALDLTTYLMFGLEGEIATILGSLMPRIPITSLHTCFVAVAVRHIIATPSGTRLRISPIRSSTFRKLSPL